MRRKSSKATAVKSADETSTTIQPSKIISTSAVHEGSKNTAGNVTEDSFVSVVTNSWLEFSNVVNRFHHSGCSNDW